MSSTTTPRAARPARGEELELRVDSLAQGGRGVARRDDGFVVFVAGALPGDLVRARVSRAKKGYAEATTVELVEPSPDRVADVCTHEGEPCPGAPWQGLPYERQLEQKAAQVDEALRRLGGLDGFESEPIVPAAAEWRYRNKLEYSFGDREGDTVLGFHRRGSWREVIDVDDCHLASEANNAARNAVRDWARAEGLPPYEQEDGRGVLRNLVVREGIRTGQVQTRLVTTAAEFPRPPVDLHTVIDGPAGGTDGPTGVLGEEHLEEELGGLRFRISHTAFFQTNTEMAERLYGIAGEYAALTGAERLFDLYCGIGTIGLSLASGARRGVGDRERAGGRRGRGAQREAQRHRERQLQDRRRAARDPAPGRGGGQARRRGRRPAARRPLEEGRPPADRGRGVPDRLRVLQPHHARAQRGAARGGRLRAAPGPAGGHVPADAPRRVRGAAGARRG